MTNSCTMLLPSLHIVMQGRFYFVVILLYNEGDAMANSRVANFILTQADDDI